MQKQRRRLDIRLFTTGPFAPCVLCGVRTVMRSPKKKAPCHPSCAEQWFRERGQ